MKTEKTVRVCLVHGFTSHCDAEWFPWLKEKLERRRISVTVPEMPHSDDPQLAEWLAQLETQLPMPDENTILIGHNGCMPTLSRWTRADTLLHGTAIPDSRRFGRFWNSCCRRRQTFESGRRSRRMQ